MPWHLTTMTSLLILVLALLSVQVVAVRREFAREKHSFYLNAATSDKIAPKVLTGDFKALENPLTVQVPLTHRSTMEHLSDKRGKLIDNAVKLSYPLLEGFKLMFNASVDYKFDYCDANASDVRETLEECVANALLTDNIDISLFPLLMTPENVEMFNFAGVSSLVQAKFIFLQPKLSSIMNVYTLPFTADVWLASSGLVIVVILFLYAITKWHAFKQEVLEATNAGEGSENNQIDEGSENNQTDELPDSFLEVSFLAVAAISQQGSEREPSGLHGRIITWSFFLTLMLLFSAYSANIIPLLQATEQNIHAVRDLLNSPLEVGVHDSTLMRSVIPRVLGADRIALLQRSTTVNKTQGIARIRAGLFAFHVETYIGYTLIEESFDEVEKCYLQEVQLLPFPTDLYFAINKNSSLFEMFKLGFIRLRETGIHHRESSLLHTPRPFCWTLDMNYNSVGLVDCYFAVALFAGGLFLSLGIFFVELFLARLTFRHHKSLNSS